MVLGFPDLICVCFVCFYCFLCRQIPDTKIKSGNEIGQYQHIKEVMVEVMLNKITLTIVTFNSINYKPSTHHEKQGRDACLDDLFESQQ